METLGESDFYDVEMSIDEDRFDGDVNEIEPKTYVSFRYYGQQSGLGQPIDPKVLSLFLSIYIMNYFDIFTYIHNKK